MRSVGAHSDTTWRQFLPDSRKQTADPKLGSHDLLAPELLPGERRHSDRQPEA